MKQIRNFRNIVLLISKSIDATDQTRQSELDVIETLTITELVITERLKAGIFTERQKDKKRKYIGLYNSIKSQTVETVRGVFSNENSKATGFVLQKYNTLAIDALFEVLVEVGPVRATSITKALILAAKRDILTLGEIDEIDAKIAQGVLQKKSKERARKHRKPLTKQQRLAAIAVAVDRIKELNAA